MLGSAFVAVIIVIAGVLIIVILFKKGTSINFQVYNIITVCVHTRFYIIPETT